MPSSSLEMIRVTQTDGGQGISCPPCCDDPTPGLHQPAGHIYCEACDTTWFVLVMPELDGPPVYDDKIGAWIP